MTVQVLISTIHQTDHSLLDKMNIQGDAIVINQCDRNEIEEFLHNGHKILWMSLRERGVGLSRNTALMRATADILLFADDDVVYVDGYEKIITDQYEASEKADMIVFNLESLNKKRPLKSDVICHRIHWYNSLKYGACRISVRRDAAFRKNLTYSLLFGGGAVHQCGEDNLYITQALQCGMNVMASKEYIGTVAQADSTWFKGYDEKYYYDRGYLFANMYGRKSRFLLYVVELREKNEKSRFSLAERLKMEYIGMRDYLCRKK